MLFDLKAILLDLTKSFTCSGGSMWLVKASLIEEGDQTFSINDSMSYLTPTVWRLYLRPPTTVLIFLPLMLDPRTRCAKAELKKPNTKQLSFGYNKIFIPIDLGYEFVPFLKLTFH